MLSPPKRVPRNLAFQLKATIKKIQSAIFTSHAGILLILVLLSKKNPLQGYL
jgi:hypothetical protein